MAHEWHAGVLSNSSWHGLESVEKLPDAATLIRRGEETGAWPVKVDLEEIVTSTGLKVPGYTAVATYLDGSRRANAPVGNRYTPLNPAEWRATVEAAVKAGAKPAGAFALKGGSRILATFEIEGGNDGSGLRNYLCLADSMDGSVAHIAGGSTVRVVCANTLRAMMGEGAHASVRHTASINDLAKELRGAIEEHIEGGKAVRSLYQKARATRLSREEAWKVIDVLFPPATEQERKETPRAATLKEQARSDAAKAMNRPENLEGNSLATIWNAATWLVDRTVEGQAKVRKGGGDGLDSMLFGSRGKRVEEIRSIIEVVLRDGTVTTMTVEEAAGRDIDLPAHIGKSASLLDELLETAKRS